MVVNTTFLDTSNNFADLASGITVNLGNLFPSILLFIIFISFYALSIRNGASEAMIAGSFATSLAGMMMMFAGFANWIVVVIPIVIFLGSLAYRFFDTRN